MALFAYIEKAFLQVGLQPGDRDVTRCLWLKDPSKPTLENNVQVCTEIHQGPIRYGTNCSASQMPRPKPVQQQFTSTLHSNGKQLSTCFFFQSMHLSNQTTQHSEVGTGVLIGTRCLNYETQHHQLSMVDR